MRKWRASHLFGLFADVAESGRRFSFFAFVRPRLPRPAPSYPPFRRHRFCLEGGFKVWQVIRMHVHFGGACNHSELFLRHTVAERTKPDFCMGGGAGNDKSIRSLARLPSLQFIALAPPSKGSRLSRFTRGLEEGGLRLLVPKILRPASETWQTGSNLRGLWHRPLTRSRIPLFCMRGARESNLSWFRSDLREALFFSREGQRRMRGMEPLPRYELSAFKAGTWLYSKVIS